MPYQWSTNPRDRGAEQQLALWPYRSLLRKHFVLFVGTTALIVALPLLTLLGTAHLWMILGFFAITISALWAALHTSYRRGETLEQLQMTADTIHLTHQTPQGKISHWQANRYWASVHLHPTGGPVENYITLKGGDREVEIGAFLDASERLALYDELQTALCGSRQDGLNPP
tara:strand:- start:216 stop:731 length:516 start_codon:yes stop_codon:yes gene_type:complete